MPTPRSYALAHLRESGVRMALLTNGPAKTQRPKIEKYGFASLFDYIQIQGEFGLGKPDQRAYEAVLAELATRPADCCMIGDDLDWDIDAPRRLGLSTIWVDYLGTGLPRRVAIGPDAIISGPHELLGVLNWAAQPSE
jgi:putative hydrolase of the HAD superfamily